MNQGEPLEDIRNADIEDSEMVAPEPAPGHPATEMRDIDMEDESGDSIDDDVQNLLDALSNEEFERDEDWLQASDDLEPVEDPADEAPMARFEHDDDVAEAESHAPAPVMAEPEPEPDPEPEEPVIAMAEPEAPIALANDAAPDRPAPDAPQAERKAPAPEAPASSDEPALPPYERRSVDLLSLQAINALGEKVTESESRHAEAMTKMGHALGMIAERIDGLESRKTDRAIADVAMAAAPPDLDEPEDADVAPYIARAERELKAKTEKSSTDIFDRIARAAETKLDDQVGSGAKVLENSSDGRRVGTKRWQPSKTVRRRMEQLEKAQKASPGIAPASASTLASAAPEEDDIALASPRTNTPPPSSIPEVEPAVRTDKLDKLDKTDPPPVDAPRIPPEPVFDADDEEDDSGLSVVPGARGRRRNRARKSRLDEDFENVFGEDDGTPSIQNLRRKMRQQPTDEPQVEEKQKASLLGGILGRKSAKKTAPTINDPIEPDAAEPSADLDELELDHEYSQDPTVSTQRKSVEIDDEDDEEWDDEEPGEASSMRKPLIYAVIALAAAVGFFAFQKFMG